MRNKILKLRNLGKTYKEICLALGCSKSLVNYYCAKGAKNKSLERSRKNRALKVEWKRKQTAYLREFTLRYRQLKGCIDCGNKDSRVLEFDHIDPSTKYLNVSRMVHSSMAIKTIKQEIRKCRVVCANCHRIRTIEQGGYYTL